MSMNNIATSDKRDTQPAFFDGDALSPIEFIRIKSLASWCRCRRWHYQLKEASQGQRNLRHWHIPAWLAELRTLVRVIADTKAWARSAGDKAVFIHGRRWGA